MTLPTRRLVLSALAPSLALGLEGCGDGAGLDGLPQGPEGRVTGVICGDVFEIDHKQQVKLAGVTAPRNGEPYADAATAALRGLLAGRSVGLFYVGPRTDRFGRTLAQVQDADDRRWIEGAMLDAGAARVRTYADDHVLAKAMLAREAAARRAGRGLWALPAYQVRLPDEVGREDEGFMVVEGRPVRAGESGDSVYLDFSADWRSAVALSVPRGVLRTLRTGGADPFDLVGRMIRVRGVVENRRLLVTHPEQIERLAG